MMLERRASASGDIAASEKRKEHFEGKRKVIAEVDDERTKEKCGILWKKLFHDGCINEYIKDTESGEDDDGRTKNYLHQLDSSIASFRALALTHLTRSGFPTPNSLETLISTKSTFRQLQAVDLQNVEPAIRAGS
ncbi:Uncharacterized protein Fot_11149 [Forsythia ovata]|uniref:Uncharacterized protein n=1 Tax=Forsythia ovata TaxID=205694 RepID=A0ABD1WIW8_9LAMI